MNEEKSIPVAARAYRLGYWTVWNAIMRGEIDARKTSRGQWLVSIESVAAFAERRSRANAAPDTEGDGVAPPGAR